MIVENPFKKILVFIETSVIQLGFFVSVDLTTRAALPAGRADQTGFGEQF